jgi:hypothetical protein
MRAAFYCKGCVSILSQIRSIALTAALICGVGLIVLGLVLLTANLRGIPLYILTGDPTAVMNVPFFTGFLSNVGVLLWAAATAICLFSAFIAIRILHESEFFEFLLGSGLLTGMLMMDDLFLFHDEVFPDHLGISQKVVYAAYVVCAFTYLLYFRTMILRTDYLLLVMALGLFAVSVTVDLHLFYTPERVLVEDGAKFLGIAFWSGYFLRVSASIFLPLRRL